MVKTDVGTSQFKRRLNHATIYSRTSCQLSCRGRGNIDDRTYNLLYGYGMGLNPQRCRKLQPSIIPSPRLRPGFFCVGSHGKRPRFSFPNRFKDYLPDAGRTMALNHGQGGASYHGEEAIAAWFPIRVIPLCIIDELILSRPSRRRGAHDFVCRHFTRWSH